MIILWASLARSEESGRMWAVEEEGAFRSGCSVGREESRENGSVRLGLGSWLGVVQQLAPIFERLEY